MTRRASAFATDLAELDNLQSLPLPGINPQEDPALPDPASSSELPPQLQGPTTATHGRQGPAQDPPGAPADTPPVTKPLPAGTRATQVRLPPPLAAWLGEEAHRTKRTLSTVVALAAREHRNDLSVRREDPEGLDVARRVASGTVPVTLRLTGAQRELLDEIAAEYAATRSAVVVAALAAAAALPQP